MNQLKEFYRTEVVPNLKKEFGLSSVMAVPKLDKVVLNMGVGDALTSRNVLPKVAEEMSIIAGQRSVITKAHKSVASFKIREGFPIGCMVTLRGDRMYSFLERMINIALPRIRDFRGLNPRSMDGQGNFSMGMREHISFVELSIEDVERVRGLDIVVCTSAKDNKGGLALLRALGFPFRGGKN